MFAQGTAFTYQGRLNDGASPANGRYDFIFLVFDGASGGSSLGGSVNTNGIAVSNGLFTVALDFGSLPFTGPQRWLQISVSTNGAGSFAPLAPRQEITRAPYATYANTAATVTNGAIANAQLAVNSVGSANIQSNAVSASQIAAGQVVKSLNGLSDAVSLTQGPNVTINTVGNSLQISAPAGGMALPFSGTASSTGSIFTLANSGTGPAAVFLGNVGIGTSNPVSKLDILSGASDGPPRLQSSGASGFAAGWDFYQGDVGKGYVGVPDAAAPIAPGELLLFGGPDTGVSLWANQARAVTVETNGNVGIGTTGPTAKLEVAGDTLINGKLDAGDTLINGQLGINGRGISQITLIVRMQPGDVYPLWMLDSSGQNVLRIGVGSVSGNTLSMYGDAEKSSGGTSWGVLSDRRLKQDVQAYEPGLNEVLRLRPVRFRYRDDAKRGLTSAQEEVGFIAQEIREVIPDAVSEGKDGYLSLKADPIHWAAINAIQALNAKLESETAALRADVQAKDAELQDLKRQFAEFKTLVRGLSQANGGAR